MSAVLSVLFMFLVHVGWFGSVLYMFPLLSVAIYQQHLHTSIPYHSCSKIQMSSFYYQLMCLKTDGRVANSVDPDHQSAASDLGLHCLFTSAFLNTKGNMVYLNRDPIT